MSAECAKDLQECERLLGMTGLNLQHELIEKDITAGGADQMTLKLKPIQATHARDALIKQLYARIFDHLVFCINAALSMDVQYDSTIGLLDVFGFESFKRNSFEQLCINYANERLHCSSWIRSSRMKSPCISGRNCAGWRQPAEQRRGVRDLPKHVEDARRRLPAARLAVEAG